MRVCLDCKQINIDAPVWSTALVFAIFDKVKNAIST